MEKKHTKEDLKKMQGWSLERKIRVTQLRIMEWYYRNNGNVYISFSGGKDSTVLLDLARRFTTACELPEIPAVFADTGLEYPEIREFVKTKSNVTWVKPEMTFNNVVLKYGYPVISKHISRRISDYRKNPNSEWIKKCFENKYTFASHNIGKWGFMKDAPFLITHKCCDVMKKLPMKKYQKETGRLPIIGTMASEGVQRESAWLKNGCNSFEGGKSQPMSFWTEQDVLRYLLITQIPYASVYGRIEPASEQISLFETGEEKLHTTGVSRTGCMFCMFGVHLEGDPNRFQRMKETHPKQYNYCINGGKFNESGTWIPNKAGLGQGFVMDYYGVNYK